MRRAGRPGRGERARVEARVREILGNDAPAIPVPPTRHRAPGVVSRLVAGAGTRIEGSRATALAMAVVVLVVILLAGAWVLSSRPKALPVPVSSSSGLVAERSPGPASPTETANPGVFATSTATTIVVDVAGKVRRPGVYHLHPGARVVDALRAAGDALPGVDLSALNLAAHLTDGEQVAVGVAPTLEAVPHAGAVATAGAGPVHLNSATIDQLETLPGVGPVLAQHILDYRSAHGSFASVGQLNDVPGIGDSKFAALRDAVVL